MQLHENLERFDQFDVNLYSISKDKPEELKQLSDALKEEYPREDGRTVTFLSDPDFQLIEHMDMRNEDTAYRGFGVLDPTGEKVFVHINDHWGEELEQTIEKIKEELK